MRELTLRIGGTPVRVREIESRKVLTPTGGYLGLSYTHTLNPYNGCLFASGGCGIYCYAQKVHPAISRHARERWGEWLDVKMNAPEVLATDLEREGAKGPLRIYMSSITDPFQPLEGKYRISEGCLHAMEARPPEALVVQTRSPLARRALPLLARLRDIGCRIYLSVTIETDDDALRRELLPRNPGIAARLALCRDARAHGIYTQVAISPLLPCNPRRFAALLDPACDRVIIDTFVLGDGSQGRRSMQLPVRRELEERGQAHLFELDAHEPLLAELRRALGEDRVLLSREGFNAVG